MDKKEFTINLQLQQMSAGGAKTSLPKQTLNQQKAQLAYGGAGPSSVIKEEHLPHVNNWLNYRLFDQYLNEIIAAINEQVDLAEEAKQAFIFNAKRTTESLQNAEKWVHFGSFIVDELEKITFAERLEMLKHPGHRKAKKYKEEIVQKGMIDALMAQEDEFTRMYKQIVEKAIAVIDLVSIYEKDLDDFVIDKIPAQFGEVLKKMDIEYLNINEGDRLDLDKCKSTDVCITDDISKEMLIKEIVQKGITLNGEVYRKASVIVYRWEEKLDD